MRPPRALWVPFELGRPLGAPEQPEFQDRVLRAALNLLQRPSGPVLEDFPEDEPAGAPPQVPLACPVSFAVTDASLNNEESLLAAFQAEVEGLRNWYDIAVQRRGRTTADTAGMRPEEVAVYIATFARGKVPDTTSQGAAPSATLKMASEDLKAYYTEAVTAQPGRATDSASLADWFWGETVAAKVLNEVRKRCLENPDKTYERLGTLLLVPRIQLYRFEA